MIIRRLYRVVVAFGLLAAATAGGVLALSQPAAADGTRVISGVTTCAFSYPGLVHVNVSGAPYWPGAPGPGWVLADTVTSVPGSQTKPWSKVISSSATTIAVDTMCYLTASGSDGSPYGTWQNWVYSITPGTSPITSAWTCSRQPVYPGPWVRTCALTSISYG